MFSDIFLIVVTCDYIGVLKKIFTPYFLCSTMTFVNINAKRYAKKTHLHIRIQAFHKNSLSDFSRVFRGPKSVSMHSAPNLEGFDPQILS